jgi:hypothetical protein
MRDKRGISVKYPFFAEKRGDSILGNIFAYLKKVFINSVPESY